MSQSKINGVELSKILATETLVAFVIAAVGPGSYFLRQIMETKGNLNLAWIGVTVGVL